MPVAASASNVRGTALPTGIALPSAVRAVGVVPGQAALIAINGLATVRTTLEEIMTRKSDKVPAVKAPKSYSMDVLAAHFGAVEGRFETSKAKRDNTVNLIRCYVVKLHDADTAKAALVKRFGVSESSAGPTLSLINRDIRALDALGWIDLPTGNKDLTMADVAKLKGIRAAMKKGDVEQIVPAITNAISKGLALDEALKEGGKVGAKTAGTTGKGRKVGAQPGAKANIPETPNKASGGELRDNSTDAKSDTRTTFTRVSENLASVISLLKANGTALSDEERAAVRDQIAVLSELVAEATQARAAELVAKVAA